jgi:hypothetical protein
MYSEVLWYYQRVSILVASQKTTSVSVFTQEGNRSDLPIIVFTLPPDLFDELESAATSHRPHRLSDPSSSWGIDIFEDEKDDEIA